MRTTVLILLTMICGISMLTAFSCDTPKQHNVAQDTVMFTDQDAKCIQGFSESTLHSATCKLGNGLRLYCTASGSGFKCDQLAGPTQQPAATPPVPTPAPAPQPVAVPAAGSGSATTAPTQPATGSGGKH